MKVIAMYELTQKEQEMYDFDSYRQRSIKLRLPSTHYPSLQKAVHEAIDQTNVVISLNNSIDYCFTTQLSGRGTMSTYVHAWCSKAKEVGFSGYALADNGKSLYRLFGWIGSRDGFHCEIPYVNRMWDGMAFQFWDDFTHAVKPIDQMDVIYYHNDLSIDDAKFWERESEVSIRQDKAYIVDYIQSHFPQVSLANSHQTSLATDGEWGGHHQSGIVKRVMQHALNCGYVDEVLLNRAHAANLIAQDYLKRMTES